MNGVDNQKAANKIKDVLEKECRNIKYDFTDNPEEQKIIEEKTLKELVETTITGKSLYEYYETEIPLAWNPSINRNGFIISEDTLKEALDSDRIKELFVTNTFGIEFPYDMNIDMISQSTIQFDKMIGVVKSIDLDKRTAIIRIRGNKFDKENINDYCLAFNYLGNKDSENNTKIIKLTITKCGLIRKDFSCYQ